MARITIEDCLKKIPSRFALVHVAAQRSRGLIKGSPALVKSENKFVVTSLREIAAGEISIVQTPTKTSKKESSR
ncbi:DNA-directed RNA polymerase subunit omega [bacterium]|nr:MAG: DNA-directed RNA polymerase subunit omega [bacterium]